jgi:hypothetical protein
MSKVNDCDGRYRFIRLTHFMQYFLSSRWDEDMPFLHHELIVRYAAGLLASTVALTVYDMFRGSNKRRYN